MNLLPILRHLNCKFGYMVGFLPTIDRGLQQIRTQPLQAGRDFYVAILDEALYQKHTLTHEIAGSQGEMQALLETMDRT